MRYAVTQGKLSAAEIESKCRQVGAKGLKAAPLTRQVFCELDNEQVARLSSMGLKVSRLEK
jgi:hypothetical protein